MSDLTSPVVGASALSVTVAPPSANVPGVPSLAAFIDLMIGKIASPAPKAVTGDGERQDDAATGNDLPEKTKDVDPALAWLFAAPPVLTPVPVKVAPLTTAVDPATPDILIASNGATPNTGADIPAAPVPAEIKPVSTDLPLVQPANEPFGASQPIKLPLLKPRLPADRGSDLPPVVAASPVTQPVAAAPVNQAIAAAPRVSQPLTASQPAAAVLPALFALSTTTKSRTQDDDSLSLTPAATPLSQPATALPVAPTGDAQRQTLDMGRQDWPQKMIDHIEALRDNANANDTSIRLKPEALGRVDIALKTHETGAVSVRFTAEQPTTRALLVDAAPQLTAAAEARGIRLSGTSVDLGGQGDQRPQPQAERAQPLTNRLAETRGDDNQAVDDGRIA